MTPIWLPQGEPGIAIGFPVDEPVFTMFARGATP